MAYELNKKIVIDTEEFNNFAVGITLPIQRGDEDWKGDNINPKNVRGVQIMQYKWDAI